MSSAIPTRRLSSDERRKAIIRTALRVFAERGFHGTTTKELAKAAGVSEALIFRHFPSKDKLYAAMQTECCTMKDSSAADGVMTLEPSTSSLVMTVHFMMAKMLRPPGKISGEENSLHRMLVHSFMGDGVFARGFMEHVADSLIAKIESCIKAATKAGDMVEAPAKPALRAWFVQHFSAMLMLNELPGKPVVDMKTSYASLTEHATCFALRGMGVKDEAIKLHYNPKAFALLMGSFVSLLSTLSLLLS